MKKINGDLTFDEMSSVMSEILNGKNNLHEKNIERSETSMKSNIHG